MSRSFSVAVVGATGLVGEAILDLLNERELPISTLQLVASDATAGRRIEYKGGYLKVANVEGFDFSGVDVALFAVPPAASAKYSPQAAEQGCVVVDLSGIWLADPQVPVVLPGINEAALDDVRERNLVAVPAGIAAQIAPLLACLLDHQLPAQISLTAMLPASAAGRNGVEELARQTARLLNSQDPEAEIFPAQSAFATLTAGVKACGSGTLAPAQSTSLALQRLFPALAGRVQCHVVRVPVFFGQSVSFGWFGDSPMGVDEALASFAGAGLGIADMDETQRGQALSADLDSDNLRIHELTGSDDGRTLGLWVSADNVRYGAALKGVQIVELLLKDYL
ncbi:MAG: Asd/ArgC dimerization domain-containing protein [Alcanivoracaceae bacterium]|nr:Asd/ArgC dimerization domain-containing protein [Alcanivoracaceae bacterium]